MIDLNHMQAELTATLQRLRATGNYPDDEGVGMRIARNFPKRLPPPGIQYSQNFRSAQTGGRLAVQVQ